MTESTRESPQQAPVLTPAPAAAPTGERPPFVEPRLRFIEPTLTPRGDLRRVTAGFFGAFSP